MKPTQLLITIGASLIACLHGMAADLEPGFKSLFNGKDLTGWEGNPALWSVQDGTITGKTTKDAPIKHNTFLVYKDGDVSNFELRLSFRIVGGNSGIQYRSKVMSVGESGPIVGGYQADFEAGTTYSGILYEERGRGILAQRGQKTVIKPDPSDDAKHKVEVVGDTGKTSSELQAAIKQEGWNDYVVIADGNHLQHFINGNLTVDVVDEHAAKAAKSGVLALQLHAGPPMLVQFKDIRIKSLGGAQAGGDLEKFQGVWTGARGEMGGNVISNDDLDAIITTFKGNKYSAEWNGGDDEGTFELNGTSTPARMEVKSSKGSVTPAIYRFTDSGLEICYGFDDAGRPEKFESPADSKILRITYKRKAK